MGSREYADGAENSSVFSQPNALDAVTVSKWNLCSDRIIQFVTAGARKHTGCVVGMQERLRVNEHQSRSCLSTIRTLSTARSMSSSFRLLCSTARTLTASNSISFTAASQPPPWLLLLASPDATCRHTNHSCKVLFAFLTVFFIFRTFFTTKTLVQTVLL